ncbi:MAG: LysR family transcriptional regulator [Proteobacteria bacterium]|nr:LysR family transcriptional regulator [Pseudomonadota bacterium]
MISKISLSSQHLDAFFAVANLNGFSAAARQLHITQSALSQRILNLESELGFPLFLRQRRGLKLTEQGDVLLRFCRAREAMETDLQKELQYGETGAITGPLRIAGYSTVLRSLVLPALSKFVRSNPGLQLTLIGAEMRTLPQLLHRGEVDFLLTEQAISKPGIEVVQLGFEEYVMVESTTANAAKNIYLDHDAQDPFTQNFLKSQNQRNTPYTRLFLDDIYGILDGAALGLGRAIVPKHLIKQDPRVSEVQGYRPLYVPVNLHFLTQHYYSKAHRQAGELIISHTKKHLCSEQE